MPGWVRALVRFLVKVWFRSLENVGVANAPRSVPTIVVANHENGLLDPLLIAACLPLAPRFVAKSTLWNNPVLRLFFVMGRVIPVYRQMDVKEGADPRKNLEMFAKVARVLDAGGSVALFPEGQSHNEPQLQPLKTGAARMALAAPAETRILPVGIAFENKDRFRARALLVVGEPIDTADARAMMATDERGAVKLLTERITEVLKRVTINVDTWTERRLLERAVEISRAEKLRDAPGAVTSREVSLEERTRHLKLFHEAYQTLRNEKPQEIESLRRDVARYDRALKMLGMTDWEVRARFGGGTVARWAIRFVRLVLLRTPIGIVGTILHAIPYRIPRALASKKAAEPDQPASWKLFASIVIFPVWWLLLAGITWAWLGWEAGLGMLVLAPISGWVALRWLESGETLLDHARAFLLIPARKRLLGEMRTRRADIASRIAELERYWSARAPAAASGSST